MLAHILLLVLAAMSTLAAPTRRDRLQPLPKQLLRRSGSTIPRSEVRRAVVPLGPAPGVYEPGYDTTPSSDSAITRPSLDSTDLSPPDQDSSSSSDTVDVDHSDSAVNRLLAVLGIMDARVESNEWEDFASVLEAALAHTTEVDTESDTETEAEEEVEHADAQPKVYGQADESVPIATEGLAWRIALSQARKKFAGLVVQDVLR